MNELEEKVILVNRSLNNSPASVLGTINSHREINSDR